MNMIRESAPHLRRKDTLAMMMLDVIIALMPTIIFSIVIYKWLAIRNILIPIATMELCEFVFILIKYKIPYDGKKHTLKEHREVQKKNYTINNFLVPLVSSLIFSLIMPVDTNPKSIIYIALILGSAFGLIIGKLVFGGTGKNIFNPAAVGMVFAKLCFGKYYIYPANSYYAADDIISAGATAIGNNNFSFTDKTFITSNYSLVDMFLGKMPGTLGEAFKITIVIGLIYLIIRRAVDIRIPFMYLTTFALDMLFVGIIVSASGKYNSNPFRFTAYQLLSGGLLFGASFMATDPVTAPLTKPGKMIYGAILGSLTSIIRLFSAYPEGVVFSILLANMLTSVIDYYKFASNKYNWKNLLALGIIVVIPLLIIIWAVCVGVF